MGHMVSGRLGELGRIQHPGRAGFCFPSAPSRVLAVLASVLLTASFATACKNDDPVGKSVGVVPGRIATMNVCNPCHDRNTSNLEAVIAKTRPEIIGLEEACGNEVYTTTDNLTKHNLHYRVIAGPTRTINSTYRCFGELSFGNYILVASHVTNEGHTNYDAQSSEERGYVWAHASLHGVKARIVVTHMPQHLGGADEKEQNAARVENAKQLVRSTAPPASDPRPTLIIGDFNAVPSEPALGPLWAHWRDADPNCKPTGGCKGTQLGEHGKGGTKKKYDYIWLDRRARTRPSRITVEPTFSDHSLVYADLRPSDLRPAPAQISEKNCRETPTNDPCLHTDTLSGDISSNGQGHGLYVAPSRMYVGSNLAINGLKWKSWGGSTATGEGWTASNDCNPNCGEGKPVRIKVEVEASTVKGVDGKRRYTCARARKVGQSWDSLGISGKVCV